MLNEIHDDTEVCFQDFMWRFKRVNGRPDKKLNRSKNVDLKRIGWHYYRKPLSLLAEQLEPSYLEALISQSHPRTLRRLLHNTHFPNHRPKLPNARE